jgi:hypothetical protein
MWHIPPSKIISRAHSIPPSGVECDLAAQHKKGGRERDVFMQEEEEDMRRLYCTDSKCIFFMFFWVYIEAG